MFQIVNWMQDREMSSWTKSSLYHMTSLGLMSSKECSSPMERIVTSIDYMHKYVNNVTKSFLDHFSPTICIQKDEHIEATMCKIFVTNLGKYIQPSVSQQSCDQFSLIQSFIRCVKVSPSRNASVSPLS